VRLPFVAAALVAQLLWAQGDPLAPPPELQAFARRQAMGAQTNRGRLQALLTSIFRPVEEGGLGIEYDNGRTRTVAEVWQERKANCISLTAFYVAACRTIGLEARYAEPLNTNRWRRVGNVVRFERHVVALAPLPPIEDAVADFLPNLRRRAGSYIVIPMAEDRFRALFYSNRAVELLDEGLQAEALEAARHSVQVDPTSAVGWNIQGVVLKNMDRTQEAEAAFRKAIALDPRDGTPIGNMEMLARSEGRMEEALKFRRMGAELRKKDPYYHAFLASEAIEEGHWEEAQAEIRWAIKLQPYDSEFFVSQARIQLQRGDVNGAEKSLEAARRWAVPGERERFDSKLAALKRMNS
jgi:tetratricopeptide (TPR) repeat protein